MAKEDHFSVIALRFDKGFRRDNLTFFTFFPNKVGKWAEPLADRPERKTKIANTQTIL
jgi:hypothetical protein